jgi:hypothetical protein
MVRFPGHAIMIGGYSVKPLPFYMISRGNEAAIQDEDGTIGNGVWSKFVTTIDYRHGQVILSLPSSSEFSTPVADKISASGKVAR